MKRLLGLLVTVTLIALLSGCASVGVNYQYTNIPKLKINEFKIEDVSTVFGKPFKTTKVVTKEGHFDIFRFQYAFADVGTARARVLILEFLNGILNSYVSLSSFDEDRTLFNEENIDQIKIGISTHDDAVNILGEPHGKANCPSTIDDYKGRCEDASTVWCWMSQRKFVTMGLKNMGGSNVFLSFDSNGKVSNIEFSK
jgi:hypothetical protein